MGREGNSDELAVSEAQIAGQILIARANQQLKIQHGLKCLDVTRISRLGKSRVDTLTDLERRVMKMRSDLKTLHVTTVVEDIAANLRISNQSHADSKFVMCGRCDRKILVRLFAAHDTACARLKSEDTLYQGIRPVPFVGAEVQQLIDTFATFVPQPPRNISMVSKGATFIEWSWMPPVFDGGLPIIDYEIRYVAKSVDFDKEKGKFKKKTETCPSLRTSQWCLLDPVLHKGYKMVGLKGATEYHDLNLRCANLLGWSEWVPMTGFMPEDPKKKKTKTTRKPDVEVADCDKLREFVKTDDADVPGRPTFFVCTAITSSCIHLLFDKPVNDGGSQVTEYLIFYTILTRTTSAVSREVFVEVSKKLRVKASRGRSNVVILRNIPADSDVVAIRVKAVSRIGLIGEMTPLGINLTIKVEDDEVQSKSSQIAKMKALRGEGMKSLMTADGQLKGVVCRTLISSRHRQLVLALYGAENTTDTFVDTDFYTVRTCMCLYLLAMKITPKFEAPVSLVTMGKKSILIMGVLFICYYVFSNFVIFHFFCKIRESNSDYRL